MAYRNQALLNRYPEFISGGEARGDTDEFVLHMRYPRYLARCTFTDDYSGSLKIVKGELAVAENGTQLYFSNAGIVLSDFVFLDKNRPHDLEAFAVSLLEACNRHVATILMIESEFENELKDTD